MFPPHIKNAPGKTRLRASGLKKMSVAAIAVGDSLRIGFALSVGAEACLIWRCRMLVNFSLRRNL